VIGVGSSVALRCVSTFDRLCVRPPACHVLFGFLARAANKFANCKIVKKAPRTAAQQQQPERQPPE